MSIEEYRHQILIILLAKTNVSGEFRFDKLSAKELLNQLSDEELEEGMQFNTPEDVADLLSEIGKL
ncbi:hypothetical protein [Prevotella fusca]|uniref:Uncharacterized protein n=1 Tax=Prevotella fusca JCM 17724 TaxID=1236517 RepID=A0A0K1NMD3_9BACT|nr:hypothetical protein [Prevotella fusca]AKU70028.1 hypothetical protein ADJ77_09355 [Prevotella fusca JCM 17724]QUB85636.1 hypothetical protein J5A51_05180 [Prevotella fusca JCM 17724]